MTPGSAKAGGGSIGASDRIGDDTAGDRGTRSIEIAKVECATIVDDSAGIEKLFALARTGGVSLGSMLNEARRRMIGIDGSRGMTGIVAGAIGAVVATPIDATASGNGCIRKFAILMRTGCAAGVGRIATTSLIVAKRGGSAAIASEPAIRVGSARNSGRRAGTTIAADDRASTLPMFGRLAETVVAITRFGTRIGSDGNRAQRAVMAHRLLCSLASVSST